MPGCIRVMSMSVEDLLEEEYRKQLGMETIGSVAFDFFVKDEEYELIRKPVGTELVIDAECKEFSTSGEVLYDEGGIRMTSMGLIKDPHGYSEDIHWLIIAENDTDEKLNVRDMDDSLSVNGFMMDFYTWGRALESGEKGLIDVEIEERSLEKNKINLIEDISEAEISFEVNNDKWKTIAKPKIAISF